MAIKKKAAGFLQPLPKKPGSQTAQQPRLLSPTTKPLGVTKPMLKPLGGAMAGRPPTNLGNYLVRPGEDEMLNTEPKLLEEVNRKFLKMKVLPTNLRPNIQDPKYVRYTDRPDVMEAGRKRAISGGFGDRIKRGKAV